MSPNATSFSENRIVALARWSSRPLLLFLLLVLFLFVAEVLVMVTLDWLAIADPVVEALVDAMMLTLLATPALYLLFLRPMIRQVSLRQLREQEAAQAQRFDRLKSEFISTAAHELCTPITVVRGYVDLLRDIDCCDSETKKQRYLDVIYDKTETLERIVDDMLDIGRNELGQPMRLDLSGHDLVAALQAITTAYRGLYAHTPIITELPEGLPPVSFDRVRIEQLFGNLLNNAIKFSPPGKPVCMRARALDAGVEVTVEDGGIGMDETTLAQVFDKFFRANNTPTAKGGLGIGLTLVKHIVDAHGGMIRIDSRLGEGTTVRVLFPLSDSARTQ